MVRCNCTSTFAWLPHVLIALISAFSMLGLVVSKNLVSRDRIYQWDASEVTMGAFFKESFLILTSNADSVPSLSEGIERRNPS